MSSRQKKRKLIKWLNKKQGKVSIANLIFVFGRSWKREMRKFNFIRLENEPAISILGGTGEGRVPWPSARMVIKSTIYNCEPLEGLTV